MRYLPFSLHYLQGTALLLSVRRTLFGQLRGSLGLSKPVYVYVGGIPS